MTTKVMRYDPRELRHIGLKWKLLVPFIFLPVALTLSLTAWGIVGQHRLLTDQEEASMSHDRMDFLSSLDLRLDLLKSVVTLASANPSVQKALALEDREGLIGLYRPVFERLSRNEGLNLLHFHRYPAKSFLRLHRLDMHGGEMASYRPSIMAAYDTGGVVGGVEYGLSGLGLRAVAPIRFDGRIVGSVEAGYSLDAAFLNRFKQIVKNDLTLYIPAPALPSGFRPLASTNDSRTMMAVDAYRKALDMGRLTFLTVESTEYDLALLVAPIKDYKGDVAAVLEISRDRSGVLGLIWKNTYILSVFGLVVLTLSLIFVWLISVLFLAPIQELVRQAEKISAGEQVPLMEVTVRDEFGALTEAINKMLAGLEESRRRLRNHAQELETKVQERTADLVESEEKFRTLVEQIPLVVYRLEPGMIQSFASPHIEKWTGIPAEELVGPPDVWAAVVHLDEREAVVETKRRCLEEGREFEMEYRLEDRQGQEVDVLDHAAPIVDNTGRTVYLEGYLLDVRERKRCEAQAVQAEELRTLSEISVRLAHEFRNPLSVVGLSARRLAKILSETGPESRHTHILIEQVGHLERILNMIQTYIRPMGLNRTEVEAETFFRSLVEKIQPFILEKQIGLTLQLDPGLPRLFIDPDLMERAMLNLLRNALYQMPAHGEMTLAVSPNGKTVDIKLVYPAGYLPDDQLRHFFFPFTTEEEDTSLVDFPLVPVIIHKHNGVIQVGREGDDLVAVTILLPSVEG